MRVLEQVEAYPDAEIVDPEALLGKSEPTPIAAIASVETAPVVEPPAAVAARPVSRTLTTGPGEEVLRAVGGGAVLRRRRLLHPAHAPKDAAE